MSSELLYELMVGFCLMLVLEGITPFLFPKFYRSILDKYSKIDDNLLRWIGLFSMLTGIGLLYLVH